MSNEKFEKIFIKSEADLPKEKGNYYFGLADTDFIVLLEFDPSDPNDMEEFTTKKGQSEQWFFSPISQQNEAQGKEYSERSLDMMQYVTNLLYVARDKENIPEQEFDEWVESEIKNIDDFMKVNEHSVVKKNLTTEPVSIPCDLSYSGDQPKEQPQCKICGDTGRGKPTLGEPDGAENGCVCMQQPERRRTAEEILQQKLTEFNITLNETFVRFPQAIIEAMQEHTRENVSSVTDEEIEAWAKEESGMPSPNPLTVAMYLGKCDGAKAMRDGKIARMNQTNKDK